MIEASVSGWRAINATEGCTGGRGNSIATTVGVRCYNGLRITHTAMLRTYLECLAADASSSSSGMSVGGISMYCDSSREPAGRSRRTGDCAKAGEGGVPPRGGVPPKGGDAGRLAGEAGSACCCLSGDRGEVSGDCCRGELEVGELLSLPVLLLSASIETEGGVEP